jgi:metallo-beta-lactamase class B
MVVTDGQKLTLGDTTLTLYLTPGHTQGTVSMLIPLKDGSQRHLGSVFGGRAPGYEGDGVRYFPTEIEGIRTWNASTKRFRDITVRAGRGCFSVNAWKPRQNIR